MRSHWRRINAGVPQGSILGPVLLLICIRDMVNWLENDSSAFADNTLLILISVKGDYDIVTVNNDLNAICNWADQCRLIVNA